MKYRIVFEADKHWGVARVEEQYQSSYIIKKYLAEQPVDLYINLGDFFDTKLLLNSKSSIYAVRDFTEKVAICRARGIPVRAIKGTRSHDYDQWDIFDSLYKDPENNLRYFRTCDMEETLPGLNILYCPEENMSFQEWVNNYYDIIMGSEINLAAFHGNFDRIMPDIAVQIANNDATGRTLIWKYEDMAYTVHGPMIAGHWHDGETYQHLSYVGSFDRWTFGETNPKGFMVVEFDTETKMYRTEKFFNVLAPLYKTYTVHTSSYKTPKQYADLIEAVEKDLENDPTTHVRLLIRVDNDAADTLNQLDSLKFKFANEKRVHFTIINQILRVVAEKKREITRTMESNYAYVKDPNMSLVDKIRHHIYITTGREYSAEEISSVIQQYIDE